MRARTAVVIVIGLTACGGGDRGTEPAKPRPAERDPVEAPEPEIGHGNARPEADASVHGWTAGVTRGAPSRTEPVRLRDLRIGEHERYDRTVWEFEGSVLPGYAIEYVDTPVRACGSGATVRLAGDGWLEIRFEPARAHTESGEVPSRLLDRAPRSPTILEARRTCDFEGVVTWVLGVRSPEPYRVLELDDPLRIVVDVRH